ncbi:MAG: DUF1573 domain-containing protein [Desulfarculaceae bacterium]
MSRPLCLIAAVLVIVAGLCHSAAWAGKAPKIVFEKTEIVFSKVKEGKVLTAVFPFANQGNMNLIIDQVSPSCGCAVPRFDKVTTPGAKGAVTVELDTTDISGNFRKTAVVSTNDPANPFITLVMLGETQSNVVVDKGRRIDLRGCVGKDIMATATLTHPEGKPLLIAGVENPMSEYLTASLRPLKGGRAYKLTVRAKSNKPANFAGPIFFRVPGKRKVSLFVVVDVRGDFAVQPHDVYFGNLKQNMASPMRAIAVTKACASELKVDSLQYNQEYFEVEKKWVKPGEKLYLEVRTKPGKLPKGPLNEKLIIKDANTSFAVRLKGVVR